MKTSDWLIIVAILGLMALRIAAIVVSPLGLDGEEAQYWLWSRTPDVGYFTKPPMIAWIIGLGTFFFGETSLGVKVFAPILQVISALLIMRIGRDAASPSAGRIAAILWMTLPANALAGFIISTDSPMIVFILAALVMLTPLAKGRRITPLAAAMAGLFTGLAMMSKYAAIYLPMGLFIWWLWQGRHDRTIGVTTVGAYAIGTVISLFPNLVWNINNGFVTIRHLSHNANLEKSKYSILSSIEFIISQVAIVGPVVFILVIIAIIRARHDPSSRFWIACFLPAITVVTVQAFFSDANINWAIASLPAAIILTAVMLDGAWRDKLGGLMRRLVIIGGIIGIGVNTALATGMIIVIVVGSLGFAAPASDPLRRLKAWDAHAADLKSFTVSHHATAIITERRGVAAKLIWELRGQDFIVELVDGDGIAVNYFEQHHPWRALPQRKIIAVNEESTPPQLAGVVWQEKNAISSHQISTARQRRLVFHYGIETRN